MARFLPALSLKGKICSGDPRWVGPFSLEISNPSIRCVPGSGIVKEGWIWVLCPDRRLGLDRLGSTWLGLACIVLLICAILKRRESLMSVEYAARMDALRRNREELCVATTLQDAWCNASVMLAVLILVLCKLAARHGGRR